MIRYYIAGPMAGIEDHNRPAFHAAEDYLARHLGISHAEIVNPASLDGTDQGRSWEACLTRDLRYVLQAQAVLALPGWDKSRGATLEVLVATSLGKTVSPYDPDGRPGNRFGRHVTKEEALTAFALAHAPWEAKQKEAALPPAETVLQEANRLIHGDRQGSYGHPLDNFKVIGDLWGAILLGALQARGYRIVRVEDAPNAPHGNHWGILPETVGLLLSALKLGREVGNHKRDNLVDAAGYAGTVDMIHAERARRNGEG